MENVLQQLQQQMAALAAEVAKLKDKGQEDMSEDVVEESEDESLVGDMGWDKVLPAKAAKPQTEAAAQLTQLLSTPPPLSLLKVRDGEFVRFSQIPVNPPPRKNKVDFHLYQA